MNPRIKETVRLIAPAYEKGSRASLAAFAPRGQLPELLVLRHGETEWNRMGRFQGAHDSRLTQHGRAQAKALGRLIGSLGVGPDSHAALTSPQGRAIETARLALKPLGLTAREDPALAEIAMGEWTGLTRAEIDARWPGPTEEPVLDFYARCQDGETLAQVASRAGNVLSQIDRPAVIVTHGLTLRILCALAMGCDLSEAARIEVRQGCLARIRHGSIEVLEPEA